MQSVLPTESHPLPPFLPQGAKVLMLGSFPPKKERWSMDFFYPNWINDMWRVMGLIFCQDKEYFIARDSSGQQLKGFDKERIMEFCAHRGIALYDAACKVKRLKDNASDKFLEVVQASDLQAILAQIPECRVIVTTGQKATDIIVETFGCKEPHVGGFTEICDCTSNIDINHYTSLRQLHFWRMPSTSRAYPLSLEKKAEFYHTMFATEKLI